jgi:hypothetical protein
MIGEQRAPVGQMAALRLLGRVAPAPAPFAPVGCGMIALPMNAERKRP